LFQSYKLINTELSFEFPENWATSKDKNIVSVYDAINGLGSLQFSVYFKNNNELINLSDELEEYLSKRHEDFEILLKENFAYCNCLDEENKLWHYWLFQKANNIIFATYNCALDDGGKEDKIVDTIVRSAYSLI
jgi:hypothetical protein